MQGRALSHKERIAGVQSNIDTNVMDEDAGRAIATLREESEARRSQAQDQLLDENQKVRQRVARVGTVTDTDLMDEEAGRAIATMREESEARRQEEAQRLSAENKKVKQGVKSAKTVTDTDLMDEEAGRARIVMRMEAKARRKEEQEALAKRAAEHRRRMKNVKAKTDDGDGTLDDPDDTRSTVEGRERQSRAHRASKEAEQREAQARDEAEQAIADEAAAVEAEKKKADAAKRRKARAAEKRREAEATALREADEAAERQRAAEQAEKDRQKARADKMKFERKQVLIARAREEFDNAARVEEALVRRQAEREAAAIISARSRPPHPYAMAGALHEGHLLRADAAWSRARFMVHTGQVHNAVEAGWQSMTWDQLEEEESSRSEAVWRAANEEMVSEMTREQAWRAERLTRNVATKFYVAAKPRPFREATSQLRAAAAQLARNEPSPLPAQPHSARAAYSSRVRVEPSLERYSSW